MLNPIPELTPLIKQQTDHKNRVQDAAGRKSDRVYRCRDPKSLMKDKNQDHPGPTNN